MNIKAKNTQLIFVQPFSLVFNHNDIHVMLYFKGHPEYEAVEALIQEKKVGKPLIRAIITRHDQSQVDYINDESVVEKILKEKIEREIYFTEIRYFKAFEQGKPYINLKFTTNKGEDINFDFYSTGKPSSSFAGLVDPEDHSAKTSLPIMYREKSILASSESSIEVDGIKYKIPKKIWIPIFFKGMKGYYSEEFSLGVFRTFSEELKLFATPLDLSPGQKWIYQSNCSRKEYEIIDQQENKLIIKQGKQKIYVENIKSKLLIEKIVLSTRTSDFSIQFNPLLPIRPVKEEKNEVNFSVSINHHQDLVSGKINVITEEGSIKFSLIPEKPEWAMKRPITTTIKQEEDCFFIKTKIANIEKTK